MELRLVEGQIYKCSHSMLLASFMLGSWVLMAVNANGDFGNKPSGTLAGYRLIEGRWVELFVAPDDESQIVYGAVVDIDVDALVAYSHADNAVDEQFLALMGDVAWEWD